MHACVHVWRGGGLPRKKVFTDFSQPRERLSLSLYLLYRWYSCEQTSQADRDTQIGHLYDYNVRLQYVGKS